MRFELPCLDGSYSKLKCRIILWSKVLTRWRRAVSDFIVRKCVRPYPTLLPPPGVELYSKPLKSLLLFRWFMCPHVSFVRDDSTRIRKVIVIPKTSRMLFGWNTLVLKLQLRVEFYSILRVWGYLPKCGRTEGTARSMVARNMFADTHGSALDETTTKSSNRQL